MMFPLQSKPVIHQSPSRNRDDNRDTSIKALKRMGLVNHKSMLMVTTRGILVSVFCLLHIATCVCVRRITRGTVMNPGCGHFQPLLEGLGDLVSRLQQGYKQTALN